MGRRLYCWLVGLHPRRFREDFGEEMIAIFDQVAEHRERGALCIDALVSLLRQWLLRPPHQEPVLSTPLFHLLDSSLPSRTALVNGTVLSLVFLTALTFFIGRSGHPPGLDIATALRPRVLGVDRSSALQATKINLKSEGDDPLYPFANAYFRMIRPLDILDADHDWVISFREIMTAPAALRRLDWNHDGKLSPEECGFYSGKTLKTKLDPQLVQRARLDFMRLNPVLAALDADHDGEISADEIKNSAAALRTLDKNRDGSLAPDEVLPDALTVERH